MPICLHADACTVQSMHTHWQLTLINTVLTGLDSVSQGEAMPHSLYLDIQVLSRPEVHDVYVEVIVSSLGQQFAQCEDFRGDVQHRLLAGAPYHHLCLAALPASVTMLWQPDHTEWAVLALERSAQRNGTSCVTVAGVYKASDTECAVMKHAQTSGCASAIVWQNYVITM